MRISDLAQIHTDRVVSIELADRFFNFTAEQKFDLVSATAPNSLIKKLESNEPCLLLPFSGASLEGLSRITFQDVGKQYECENKIISKANQLAAAEQAAFRENWQIVQNGYLSDELLKSTNNLNSFLHRRNTQGLLQADHSKLRREFLSPPRLIDPNDPIRQQRSKPSWLLLDPKQEEGRAAMLNELVACAVAAASLNSCLRQVIDPSCSRPIFVLRHDYTTDSHDRKFVLWEKNKNGETKLDSKGQPIPIMKDSQLGISIRNEYFKAGNRPKSGDWAIIGCTAGTGTVVSEGSTFLGPAEPPHLKISVIG